MKKWLLLGLGAYVFYMTNGFACTADGKEGLLASPVLLGVNINWIPT